jgi:hypothetical protein
MVGVRVQHRLMLYECWYECPVWNKNLRDTIGRRVIKENKKLKCSENQFLKKCGSAPKIWDLFVSNLILRTQSQCQIRHGSVEIPKANKLLWTQFGYDYAWGKDSSHCCLNKHSRPVPTEPDQVSTRKAAQPCDACNDSNYSDIPIHFGCIYERCNAHARSWTPALNGPICRITQQFNYFQKGHT